MTLSPGFVAGVAIILIGLAVVYFMNRQRTSARDAAAAAPAAAPARNGAPTSPGPALDEVRRWLAAHELPCAFATVEPDAPSSPLASRLGGGVWLAAGEAWPLSRNGNPLAFIAQLNFADLPPLDGYPRAGLLQIFVGDDDLYGADFDKPQEGEFRVIWRPEPGDGALAYAPTAPEMSPFNNIDPGASGHKLTFRAARMSPDFSDERFEEAFPLWWQAANAKEIEALFDDKREQETDVYVGGHPRFTQSDIRTKPELAGYDRVLLQIGYVRDVIMWGDVGEATWLIPQDDLRRQDFSRAAYSWDCH